MRCHIDIDSKALTNNFHILQELSSPATCIPVIKANAYGHGLSEVLSILSKKPLEWIAVNYPNEGIQARKLGYQGRVLVVGPSSSSEFDSCVEYELEPVLSDFINLETWKALKQRPLAHIKIDTGMSRQGFLPHQIDTLIKALSDNYRDQIYGLCSHFANVEDVLEQEYALLQLQRFQEASKKFQDAGFDLNTHFASSASTLLSFKTHFSMTRTGISLYGLWPSDKTKLSYHNQNHELVSLEPVLSWYTEVAMTKTVEEGTFIGYGCSYRTNKKLTLAVLPVGYYEGYPRLAGSRGAYVLIRGKRCPVIGRICMNMMMVDVTHLDQLEDKEKVTLIGRDQTETITAGELASWADTIHYELLCCLNPEIPRNIV